MLRAIFEGWVLSLESVPVCIRLNITNWRVPVSANNVVGNVPKALLCGFCLVSFAMPGYALAKDKGKDKKVAAAADEEEKPGWSGTFSFGLKFITGNTNTGSGNADLSLVYDPQTNWKHTIAGSADYGERAAGRGRKKTEMQNASTATYKAEYALNPRDTLIGYVGYESDKIAGLDSEYSAGAAYSRKLFQNKRNKLSASLGAAYISRDYNDGTDGLDETAGRFAVDYKGKITDSISISERIVVLAGSSFTTSRAKTDLKYAITDKVGVVLKHEVTHNTYIPLSAIDKTDSTTKLNLEIDF